MNYRSYLGHKYFSIEKVKLSSENWLTYYEKEETVNMPGVYIKVNEIKKEVECIGILYCNIYRCRSGRFKTKLQETIIKRIFIMCMVINIFTKY